MTEVNDEDNCAIACGFLGFFLVFLLVPVVWLLWGFNHTYRQCVDLNNGLNLGYEAVFDLSKPYFRPVAVPRFADGTPVIRDELWSLFVTDTTIYGLTMAKGDAGFSFAWRADAGLVLKRDDPAQYEKLLANAGHANWDLGTDSIDTGALLYLLRNRPEFARHWCRTSLFTW